MANVRLVAITRPIIYDGDNNDELTPQEFLIYCARVSNPKNQNNHKTGPQLCRYLIEHKHWSPFEMVNLAMEIETSRAISRQIIRHRAFHFQEFSQRYAESGNFQEPSNARMRDSNNRQNSIEIDPESSINREWLKSQKQAVDNARALYERALELGIAKEVARSVLPEGLTTTRLFMSGTLRDWIHYIKVRTSKDTQLEHRQVAFDCAAVIHKIFPDVIDASFID